MRIVLELDATKFINSIAKSYEIGSELLKNGRNVANFIWFVILSMILIQSKIISSQLFSSILQFRKLLFKWGHYSRADTIEISILWWGFYSSGDSIWVRTLFELFFKLWRPYNFLYYEIICESFINNSNVR